MQLRYTFQQWNEVSCVSEIVTTFSGGFCLHRDMFLGPFFKVLLGDANGGRCVNWRWHGVAVRQIDRPLSTFIVWYLFSIGCVPHGMSLAEVF